MRQSEDRMRRLFKGGLLLAFGVGTAVNAQSADSLKARFSALFGAGKYAKIVWQVEGKTGRKPNFDLGAQSKIMALDTKDGIVRELVAAEAGTHWSSPSLTWDGLKVVFTDNAQHRMLCVNWDGTSKKVLLNGYDGDGHCWRSPDNKNWALVTTWNSADSARFKLERVNVDDTAEVVTILDSVYKRPSWSSFSCWASMSVDGRYVAAGFPNWPNVGLLNVQTHVIQKPTQNDSWPTIARDNTYDMLYCNSGGNHKQIRIVDSTMAEKALVNLGTSALTDSGQYEALRWSNDRAYISVYVYKGGSSFSTVGISNPRVVRISDANDIKWAAIDDNPQFPQGNADVLFYEGSTGFSPQAIAPKAAVVTGKDRAGVFDSRGRAMTGARALKSGVYVSTGNTRAGSLVVKTAK